MQTNLHVTSGPAIEKAGDLAGILTNLQEGDILFIDNERRKNKIQFPLIKKVTYKEKLWPKVSNTFLRRTRDRS